jgi:hypothetical protein
VAFAVPDLAPLLERIATHDVEILDGPYDFDGRPAVLIDGPDGLAVEIVEVGAGSGQLPPEGE